MTDLRKAAEMALKWMEATNHTAMRTYSDEAYEEHCKVEIELRQALAQDELVMESANSATNFVESKHLAQPEQTKCPRCGEVNPAEIHTCSPQVAQPEQEKESTAQTVDPRLLLGRSNNFTKETENRLCDIERRLAAIETQPALAQPEQEPIAWKDKAYGNLHHQNFGNSIPLYTAPLKREWVGLTEDEIIGHTCECVDDGTFNMDCAINFANSMQEALKRYNT